PTSGGAGDVFRLPPCGETQWQPKRRQPCAACSFRHSLTDRSGHMADVPDTSLDTVKAGPSSRSLAPPTETSAGGRDGVRGGVLPLGPSPRLTTAEPPDG